MIIKIHSQSECLLDILQKHPTNDNGLYLKPLRNGYIIGNAVDKYNYEILFADRKHSYSDGTSQIDYRSLCDGNALLNILTELFNHIFSITPQSIIKWLDRSYADVDNVTSITVENLLIDSNYVKDGKFFLAKYLDGLILERKYTNIYRLTVTASTAVAALNRLALVGFLLESVSYNGIFLTTELVQKYIRILGNVKEAPYFLYYLLNKKLGDKFGHLIPQLELNYSTNNQIECKFTPNNTQDDRIKFVQQHIDLTFGVLDYGCGEFNYSKALIKNLAEDKPYYSYDIVDYLDLHDKLKDRYPNKKWIFTTDLETIPKDEPLTLLASEIIEHNPIDKALELLTYVIQTFNINKVILTTPNINFNRYYQIDTLRHEDHVQELNMEEFVEFVTRLAGNCLYTIMPIGDVIGIEPVTFGAVIELTSESRYVYDKV